MLLYNKGDLAAIQKEALDKLIIEAGGATHLAKMLDLERMVVIGWQERGRVSFKGATMVGDHPTLGKKFRAEELRPDM